LELSELIKSVKLPWILTYDKEPIIYELYKGYQIREINLTYSAATKRIGTEVIIFSNNLIPQEQV
jgi:DNA adenine methylase